MSFNRSKNPYYCFFDAIFNSVAVNSLHLMMNACSLSLLFSNSEYTYLFEKLLAWTVEEVEKWVCFVGFEEEAALFSSKQYFHERPCMVVTIALMAPSCFATHFAKHISIYQLDT